MVRTFCPTPPVTCVPGATISGFTRPSLQGPRLENPTMSLALLASSSAVSQPSVPSVAAPLFVMACEWTFSAAPTVMTFLAVPGEPTVPAAEPALPAANTIVMPWLPATGTAESAGCASRTRASYCCASMS